MDALRKPLIGILTMEDKHNQFRGNRENFIDIIQTGQQLGMDVIVLTPQDLKLDLQRVYGYQYQNKEKKWIRKIYPLPRVIYNRIPSRDDEMLPEVQRVIRACIRHPYIQLFNPSFFNKWTLFEWLKKSKATHRYIPETKRLTKHTGLQNMLHRYGLLYLKPERGKAGMGIMRVKRFARNRYPYRLSYQVQRKSHTMQFKTLGGLRKQINEMMGEESYIVQQGIRLALCENRPFDLRVLVQKNKRGLWAISGIGARIAGSSSITTHVPRGGSIDEPQRVLSSVFGTANAKKLMRQARKTAITIAKQLERGSGHLLGEMSIDLGVDKKGHLWFFEANAKPMKFDEPDIRKKSLHRLLQYAKFLANGRKTMYRKKKIK